MKNAVFYRRRLGAFVLALCLVVGLSVPAVASEAGEVPLVEIYTAEDLLAMAEDPAGSYILMADLDMTGVAWKSLDFRGSFDGNGHTILNLTISQPGDEKPYSYDGNNKGYETSYVGMFGTLWGATIKNLNLLNVRAVIESDTPCFLGGIAGYADHSTITNCTVSGCLELRAHDRMFGVGGVIGHGNGAVAQCEVDVTLICTDTDSTARDEQFLGGVFATGFVDVVDCVVNIDGYVSDHGYVHSGGIAGMYMRYPLENWKTVGYITGNVVSGKITFFEDNTDRRAYCEAVVGEPLASNVDISGNTTDFLRDEKWTYDAELRPCMCQSPSWQESVVEATCQSYGYRVYTCDTCGYTYTDDYTLFSDHTVSQWSVTEEPTLEREGLSVGFCDICGLELQRREPRLEPEPTEETEPLRETESQPQEQQENDPWGLIAAGTALIAVGLGAAVLVKKKRK